MNDGDTAIAHINLHELFGHIHHRHSRWIFSFRLADKYLCLEIKFVQRVKKHGVWHLTFNANHHDYELFELD